MFKSNKKGQSTAEYAIIIGVVIAAVVAMQVYVKRGIQAKFKDASDAKVAVDGGSDYGVNSYKQFEPQYSTTSDMVSSKDITEKATVSAGGGVKREIVGEEVSSRTGTQEILATDN
ncbi:MAG: hypothetical protein M0R17_14715 [Candidatus Omnitrophica bacterium]|jgi:Flp pilus assembly pilin Flp|nr:hypothetical protein [Candidatus Omnitrophota bacterium]MDD5253021.1 hypothetical protein [Candidatus Omnitrophota bacterium]